VQFQEDASQVRKDNGLVNLNNLRKITLNRLRATGVPNKQVEYQTKNISGFG
jgi:hypothetical protein